MPSNLVSLGETLIKLTYCRQDPFAKKELYAIKAPSMFAVRNAGKTIVNRTAGQSKFLGDHCIANEATL